MPKYLIERTVPGVDGFTAAELRGMSAQSNEALATVGHGVQWVQSYVSEGRLHCIYNSPNQELIYEHARVGGFPCDKVSQVSAIIDPVTGE